MSSSISTVLELLTTSEFLGGVIAGIGGLAVFLLVRREGGLGGWAVALTMATLLVFLVLIAHRPSMTAGFALLTVGGWLASRPTRSLLGLPSRPVGWIVLFGGSLLVVSVGGLPDQMWVRFGALVIILGGGAAMQPWGHHPRRNLVGPLVAVTAFGIWTTVPDTDTARIMLGVSIPLALATQAGIGARVSAAGAFPLAALVAWVGATGGAGRPGSIVGAWATLGLLVLVSPLVAQFERISEWELLALHVIWVFFAARVFGLWESATSAALGLLIAGMLLFGLSQWVFSRKEFAHHPPRSR